MSNSRISAYASTAGRLHVADGQPVEATVSPLAAPGVFALENDLRIDFIARDYTDDGMVLALLLTNQDGNSAALAGAINGNSDEQGATTVDDLDFVDREEAAMEVHIALDEYFGDRAPQYRRELVKAMNTL